MSRPEWLQLLAAHFEHGWGVSRAKTLALVQAAEIVCDLAAKPTAEDLRPHDWWCEVCDAINNHTDSCPWKRSRLWMEQHNQ